MQFKLPKDDDKYHWTSHAKAKMIQYRLSESLIKRIMRYPKRTEEGIAERTVAVMQSGANTKKPQEVWVMYQIRGTKKIIISAWRYPGVSTPGKKIIIPDEVMAELEKWFKKT